MSEPERPFLPMSGELGGDFMSGMADSIRERGAREVPEPEREEGVEKTTVDAWERVWEEEEWEEEEDEWEDEEDKEEWEEEELKLTEKALNAIEALLPRLVGFMIDVATIALIPTTLTLLALALLQRPVFDFLETALMLGVTTAVALMIADAKQRLLQRLKQPKF